MRFVLKLDGLVVIIIFEMKFKNIRELFVNNKLMSIFLIVFLTINMH